jgi:hypothetical protein
VFRLVADEDATGTHVHATRCCDQGWRSLLKWATIARYMPDTATQVMDVIMYSSLHDWLCILRDGAGVRRTYNCQYRPRHLLLLQTGRPLHLRWAHAHAPALPLMSAIRWGSIWWPLCCVRTSRPLLRERTRAPALPLMSRNTLGGSIRAALLCAYSRPLHLRWAHGRTCTGTTADVTQYIEGSIRPLYCVQTVVPCTCAEHMHGTTAVTTIREYHIEGSIRLGKATPHKRVQSKVVVYEVHTQRSELHVDQKCQPWCSWLCCKARYISISL